jgi:hypothetical protein
LVTTKRHWYVLGAAVLLAPLGCGDSGGDDDVTFADARPGAPDAAPSDAAPPDAMPTPDAMPPPPDAPMNNEGPAVTVIAPTAPAPGDYSSDAIVTDRRFTARCLVEGNPNTGDPVDPTSVRLSAIGETMSVEAAAQPTGAVNEYGADLNVGQFGNGLLMVRCTAADTASRTNSDEIQTYLDLGPRVDVFAPVDGSSYASQMDVVFKVTAAPVAMGDTGGAPDLDAVEVLVGGTVVGGFTHDATGLFQGTIEFDDPAFPAPLDGLQTLTIRVPNMRSPDPVVRSVGRTFNADADGPTIAVVSPEPGALVSGIVNLEVTASDTAGVDPDSVVATVAGVHQVELTNTGGNTYQGIFDTRLLTGMVFPTIVVRAKDLVGNQSSSGFVVALDNVPPVASLDPPPVRESRVDTDTGLLLCSRLFDPVGDDAVNDGQTVAQLSELRARVNDLGNTATAVSSVNIPIAGVDASSVQLWVLDDSNRALIVDTDNDGICDAINPLLQPASVPVAANEAAVIDMQALAPTGASWFAPPSTPFAGPAEDACNEPELSPAPAALCSTTPATRVTETNIGSDPVIYGLPPAGGNQCLGNAFDSVATNISDGWACLAVRSEDNLGNVGISPPMRVCFDRDGDQSDGCLPWGEVWDEGTMGALADCTGTYNAMTNTVDAAASCTLPLTFADDPFFQVIRIDI